MYPCPNCGRPWVVCGGRCRRRNEELSEYNENGKIDISFDLWMVDKFNFNPIKIHEHNHNKQTLMITKKWEDIAVLMCENLISIMKYANACIDKNEKITKNETMHDYILTRIENIERSYSCLYINKKMNEEEFNYFERNQKTILFMLTGEKDYTTKMDKNWIDKNWEDEIIFKDYIDTILNSDFFKNNDIRIE